MYLGHVSSAGNRCNFVLLDKDESCPTADLSNIGRPSSPAYSTGELLNMPQVFNHRVIVRYLCALFCFVK